jgi:hypothetical protein
MKLVSEEITFEKGRVLKNKEYFKVNESHYEEVLFIHIGKGDYPDRQTFRLSREEYLELKNWL